MSSHDFGKVAVLMGGPSAEREVSLKGGERVLSALQSQGIDAHGIDADTTVLQVLRDGEYERVFIVLHGRWGEDGLMQGALDVLGIPYTGSSVLGSALAMDKWRSKMLMCQAGVPTPDFALVRSVLEFDAVAAEVGFPMVIKPSREGSSIGTFKVHSRDEMESAWRKAREFDDDVLAEAWVEGQELTVAVLGDKALPVIRIKAAGEVYDYDAKYVADSTQYFCPSGLDESTDTAVRRMALDTFALLDCSGWGRVDFMVNKYGQIFVLEVNTIPGMTDHSLVPMAAEAEGLSFEQLAVRILETSHAVS